MNKTEQIIKQQTYTHTQTTITYKDKQRHIEYRIQTRLDLAFKGPNTHTLNKNSLQADFTNTPQYASQTQHLLYNTKKSLTHAQKTQRHIQLPQTSTTCTLTYSQPVNRGIIIKPYKQTLPHIAQKQLKNKKHKFYVPLYPLYG